MGVSIVNTKEIQIRRAKRAGGSFDVFFTEIQRGIQIRRAKRGEGNLEVFTAREARRGEIFRFL